MQHGLVGLFFFIMFDVWCCCCVLLLCVVVLAVWRWLCCLLYIFSSTMKLYLLLLFFFFWWVPMIVSTCLSCLPCFLQPVSMFFLSLSGCKEDGEGYEVLIFFFILAYQPPPPVLAEISLPCVFISALPSLIFARRFSIERHRNGGWKSAWTVKSQQVRWARCSPGPIQDSHDAQYWDL